MPENITEIENTTLGGNFTDVAISLEYEESVLHFTLIGGNHTEDIDATTVNITFSTPDLNEIKRIFGLAISDNTTYITFPVVAVPETPESSTPRLLYTRVEVM